MANNFLKQPKGFATKAIHFAQEPENWNSMCLVPPIVTSATFKQIGPNQNKGYLYGRDGNPTRDTLEGCLAALDNGKYCVAFSSGLGASTAALSILNYGDHIIVCDELYGRTSSLIKLETKRIRIPHDFVDLTDINNLKKHMKPNTKIVWIESPSNPLQKIIDIKAVADYVHQFPGAIVVVDNTFLTPYFQRPLELGADLVVYSLTKFMNGHSDVVMGAAITNSDDIHERLRFSQIDTGIVPSPFDCYQVNRSLKTLVLRMEQHSKNSLAVAKFLENNRFVDKVLHPGLLSHPQHKIATSQSYGHSGIMSFYIKGDIEVSKKFLMSLKVITLAASLGGPESLAGLPALVSHVYLSKEERLKLGITDNLIRLSVGLEDIDDIIEDLEQALEASQLK